MNTTANNSGTTVPSEPKQLVAVKCRVPLASIKQWIESKETKNFLHVIKHQNGLPLTLTCEDFYYYDKGCGVLYLYDHSQLHLTFKAWQDIVYKELQLGLVPVDFGSVTNEQTIEWLKSERTKKAIQGIKDRHGEGDRNYLVGTRNKDTGKFLLHPELIPTFKADFGIETKPTTEPVVTLPTEVTSQKITPQHTTLVTSQTSVEPEESAQVTFLPEVPDNYHLVNEKLLKEEIRSLRDRLSCGEITEAEIITDVVFRGRFKSEISRSHKGLLKEIATSGEKAYIFNRKTQTLWCHPRLAEAFLNPVPVDEEEIPFIQTEVIPREEREMTEEDLTDPDNVELRNAVLEATGLLEPAKKEMERLHSIEENLKNQLRRVNQKDAETGESPLSLTGSATFVSEPTFVRLNEVLQQHSLTRGQFLDFVKSDKGTKSQSAIATNLGIEPSDVVNWIDRNNPFVCQEYCNTFVVWAEAAAKTIETTYWELEDLTATFFLSDGEFEQFNGLKSSVALRKQIIGTEGIEAVVYYGDKAKLHPDYRDAFVKWIKDPWPEMPGHYMLIPGHFDIGWDKTSFIDSHDEILEELEEEGEPGETVLARAKADKPCLETIQEFTEYLEEEAGETLARLNAEEAFTYGWKDGLFWCHPNLYCRFKARHDQAASMSLLELVEETKQDLDRFLTYFSTNEAIDKAEGIMAYWGLEKVEVLNLSNPDDPRVDGHLFDHFLMKARREDNPLPDYIPYHQVLKQTGATPEQLFGFECNVLALMPLRHEAEKFGLSHSELSRRQKAINGEDSVKEYHPAFVKVFRQVALGEGETDCSLLKVARKENEERTSEFARVRQMASEVVASKAVEASNTLQDKETRVVASEAVETSNTLQDKECLIDQEGLKYSPVPEGCFKTIDNLHVKAASKDYLSVRQVCQVVNDLLKEMGSPIHAKVGDVNQALAELGYQKKDGRKWPVLPAGRHLRRGNQWLNSVCQVLADKLAVVYLTAKELLEKIKTSLDRNDITARMLSKALEGLGLHKRMESSSEKGKKYKYWGVGQSAIAEDGTVLVKAKGSRRVVYHSDCVSLLSKTENQSYFQKPERKRSKSPKKASGDCRCLDLIAIGLLKTSTDAQVKPSPVIRRIEHDGEYFDFVDYCPEVPDHYYMIQGEQPGECVLKSRILSPFCIEDEEQLDSPDNFKPYEEVTLDLIYSLKAFAYGVDKKTAIAIEQSGEKLFIETDGVTWCHGRILDRYDYNPKGELSPKISVLLEKYPDISESRFLAYLESEQGKKDLMNLAEKHGLDSVEIAGFPEIEDEEGCTEKSDEMMVDENYFRGFVMKCRREDNPLPDYISLSELLTESGVTLDDFFIFQKSILMSYFVISEIASHLGLTASDMTKVRGKETIYHPSYAEALKVWKKKMEGAKGKNDQDCPPNLDNHEITPGLTSQLLTEQAVEASSPNGNKNEPLIPEIIAETEVESGNVTNHEITPDPVAGTVTDPADKWQSVECCTLGFAVEGKPEPVTFPYFFLPQILNTVPKDEIRHQLYLDRQNMSLEERFTRAMASIPSNSEEYPEYLEMWTELPEHEKDQHLREVHEDVLLT
ncbi:hypothetical protein [Moorena sp. SIO3I8]|uniref:hypothetical protein n=1 Tax=Moorena sp. SIO3I8 TaxID=2607833 RepID=UPI0013C1014C|nr:hypothetical protein [Moorena sp. SIO3I8]NEO07804.1 hypothetical protein [Moorena sp. SIO3I8]